MAKEIRTKTITLGEKHGTFNTLFQRFTGSKKEMSDLAALRNLLSNEKARLLHTIKVKQPNSLYQLAKILGRDFKSVRQDVKLLERFGFIEMIPIRTGKREKLKPVLGIDVLEIKINI